MTETRHALLKDYDNPVRKVDLSAQTMVGLFEDIAELLPEELAVKDRDLALTYGEINAIANQLGRVLLSDLSEPGETAAAISGVNTRMILIELGVLKARKILVGLSPLQPFNRLVELIQDSDSHVLIHTDADLELAAALAAETSVRLINADALP